MNFRKSYLFILAAGIALAVATTANASVNLVTNGNFATGDFTGWVVGGNNTGYPPAVVATNNACCFGEYVPADTLTVGSPDLGGTHAVYFVDDFATQTLTQSVYLKAGNYAIGFDSYAPYNGYSNPGNANFTATIAGVQLASYSVKGTNAPLPGQWVNFAGVADVLQAGNYNVQFNFQTFGGASADILIDRVYVATTTQANGIPISPVPEPESYAMLLAGLGLLGFMVPRKKSV